MPLIAENLKNLPGWSCNERLVAFAVDDYGNVRLHSAAAKDALSQRLGSSSNRFDSFDSLETRRDLEALFEVLGSVKDSAGSPAVFSPYAISMNIDFSSLGQVNEAGFSLQTVSDTFQEIEAEFPLLYAGTQTLWRDGVQSGLLAPEYHGAVHFSTSRVENWLKAGFPEFEAALAERSVVLFGRRSSRTAGWTAAFQDATDEGARSRLVQEFTAGLEAFSDYHRVEPVAFTPSAHVFPRSLLDMVRHSGLSFIDLPRVLPKERGNEWLWQRLLWSGRELIPGLRALTRNVVFEPGDDKPDSVGSALRQIEAAFRFGKPALISSHRVNFAGGIDPQNRIRGLNALQDLLLAIVKRWPDVRFVSVRELTERIQPPASATTDV